MVLALASGCARLGALVGHHGATKSHHGAISSRLTTGKDKRDMTIKVTPPLADFRDAKAEARYAATKYCIKWTGSSEAQWAIDKDTGDWAAPIVGGALVFVARCTG